MGVLTIVVGNLKVGGTGKTPFVEYLTRHFIGKGVEFCLLSRGYGRKSKGFKQADKGSTWEDIGDEPLQYYSKFAHQGVKVFVGENRVNAIKEILRLYPSIQLVLLDDAFQHRALKANRSILLSEFQYPFYSDYLMPMGRLRESRIGARRADAIIVTKSPPGSLLENETSIQQSIQKYSSAPVFFTYTSYLPLVFFPPSIESSKNVQRVVLVCGIANPHYFLAYCATHFHVLKIIQFPDHYAYSEADMEKIEQEARSFDGELTLLTTEKDATRLSSHLEKFKGMRWAYLPISLEFHREEEHAFQRLLSQWTN
jgi:tetraacyldisaccharide 4'-kinase